MTLSGNLHPSDGPTALHAVTNAESEVLLGGAGVIHMSVCCGAAVSFSWGPAPSLFLSSRPENWLRGRTWARDLDLFTGVVALGLCVILDCTLVICPPMEPPGGRILLTTCSAVNLDSGSSIPGHDPWLLAAQCNPTTSATVPVQRGWREGLLSVSSITRPSKPGLCCVVTSLCLVAEQ